MKAEFELRKSDCNFEMQSLVASSRISSFILLIHIKEKENRFLKKGHESFGYTN